MTLSNIFFGKKVVQQAYFNNALIYQSKGWETLPSTLMEVWRKHYTNGGYIYNLVKDNQDNILFIQNGFLIKINTDGAMSNSVALPNSPIYNASIDYYLTTDSKNNVWLAANYSYSPNISYLVKIYKYNNRLELQSTFDYYTAINKSNLDNAGEYYYPMITWFSCRNDFLYISSTFWGTNINGYSYADTFIHKFDLNFKLVDSINYIRSPRGESFSITIADVDYQGNIYFAYQGSIFLISANLLGNKNTLIYVVNGEPSNGDSVPSTKYVNSIYVDRHKNIYYTDNHSIKKINANYKLIWACNIDGYAGSNDNIGSIVSDSKDDIYFYKVGRDSSNITDKTMYKYSSDGTLIWKEKKSYLYSDDIIAIDSFDNIYTVDLTAGNILGICKSSNIEKKGN